MGNYYNTLPLREQLNQLGVCEFMDINHTANAPSVNSCATLAGTGQIRLATRHALANANNPTAMPKKATGMGPRCVFICFTPEDSSQVSGGAAQACRSDVL